MLSPSFPALLPCYVVLDLETTGGNAQRDNITEIAAVRIENGVEVARWSTLVNPGVQIAPFIQSLTGITDAMVQDAPAFEEVARPLLDILDGAVFVAHNVRFDHGFVHQALERLGHTLKVKTLCTVRLSRKLYPQHKGHGLDALLQREAASLLQGSASVPPQLETSISDIPDTPGVYLFYGEGEIPLYIGKSVHMRTRVLSHFQASTKQAREMRILQEIRRVEWQETAGELGALLLEARLVKAMQPLHNRQLRQSKGLSAWELSEDPQERPLVRLVGLDAHQAGALHRLYGVYRSKRQATDALRTLCENHGLCPQALGLESGKGACFASQIGKCKGVCAGRESPAVHRLRLQMALAQHRLQAWPHPAPVAVREFNPRSERTDIHVFDQWCHVATVHDESDLADALQTRHRLAFDLDTYRLLLQRLAAPLGRDASVFLLPEQIA